ncbi:hypothetical protein O1Q96_17495 [Streptomyces sp. Qhu-G9]|uniref:hypothetical protein n=1 Tax=Streptomyces sp. Qhu-G9 TaxID=3452799 RepID=UPI0022AC57B8|nr:hypothetical protein [Streptomyces aurantiacus]WAU86669.1 hypothetical protein O1Q96_17495 [Streptomyces aurantiacus]
MLRFRLALDGQVVRYPAPVAGGRFDASFPVSDLLLDDAPAPSASPMAQSPGSRSFWRSCRNPGAVLQGFVLADDAV